jgi:cytochrome c biogenesis protein CcdA
LLLSSVLSIGVGAAFSVAGFFDGDAEPFAMAGGFLLSVVGAVLLRRHWHSLRAWSSTANDWLVDRPAIGVGLYVLLGMLFSLSLGLSVAHLAFGGALWGLGGWMNVRRDRRPRGDATA